MISDQLTDEEYLAMLEDESLPPVDRVVAWLYSSDGNWPVDDAWLLVADYYDLLHRSQTAQEHKMGPDYVGWAIYVVLALLALGYFGVLYVSLA